MRLSAAFIVDQLKKNYTVLASNEISTAPDLIRPALTYKGMKPEDYVVYIIDSTFDFNDYMFFPKHCLIIILGNTTNFNSQSVCTIQGASSLIEVFTQIQNIFTTYSAWQVDLINAYLKGKSIQELLSISLPIFNNSLEIVGMDFSFLASALLFPIHGKEEILGSTEATLPFVTNLKNNELYYQVRELDGAFYFPSSVTGLASLCVNIKQQGKTTHRLLMIEDSRPIKKCEGFLLEFLSSIIEHILNHSMAGPFTRSNKVLHEIFENVLTNKSADYVEISQMLNTEGWYPTHEYICAYFELTKLDKRNETYNPMIHYLNTAFVSSCALIHNGDIVIYVNMTLAKLSTKAFLERIAIFTDENYLCAGVSSKMCGHMSLRRQYTQALSALTIGSRKCPQKFVHIFNEISLDYVLQQSTKHLPGHMVCHEKLLILEHNDKTKGTEYMKTLRMFLDNQCNVLQTAQKMFLHRSTMLYRLEKIKEILGSNLKDPDEIMYLMLSFRLIDMEEEKATCI